MKLYDFPAAPSPRRVNIFLAEKGLAPERIHIDLRAGEHRRPDFLAVNPEGVLPWLVTDTGEGIGESMAICRYLEALHPEPALCGRTPEEIGRIEYWNRRAEFEGYLAAGECFRNATPGFRDRALPGSFGGAQIPALVERGRARLAHFHAWMDARLAVVPFLAGSQFSVADVTALVAVDFGGWSKVLPEETHPHLRRWHAEVSARPSVQAARA